MSFHLINENSGGFDMTFAGKIIVILVDDMIDNHQFH